MQARRDLAASCGLGLVDQDGQKIEREREGYAVVVWHTLIRACGVAWEANSAEEYLHKIKIFFFFWRLLDGDLLKFVPTLYLFVARIILIGRVWTIMIVLSVFTCDI